MRDIKSRGKRIDDGDWVCGYFTKNHSSGKCYITTQSTTGGAHPWEVDHETVGQYTGLSDKSGKEIYEGDIVHLASEDGINYTAQIIFKDGGFCAIDGTIDNYSLRRYSLSRFDLEIEIIGNIYENQELLLEVE